LKLFLECAAFDRQQQQQQKLQQLSDESAKTLIAISE
jgi:hypothetical protein